MATWMDDHLFQVKDMATWMDDHLFQVKDLATWMDDHLFQVKDLATWMDDHLFQVKDMATWMDDHLFQVSKELAQNPTMFAGDISSSGDGNTTGFGSCSVILSDMPLIDKPGYIIFMSW